MPHKPNFKVDHIVLPNFSLEDMRSCRQKIARQFARKFG